MRWGIRLVALGIVVIAAVIGWYALRPGQRSAVITGPWDRLDGQPWLLPDLHDALVVLPDRPHTREEAERARAGSPGMGRTRSYRLSTNSRRLRGGEIGPKAAGTTRIVAIGDSVTHGWGVAEGEAWPARLGEELRARGQAVEVINAGVPANDIRTMGTWCEREAPTLAVDRVIWTRRPPGNVPDPLAAYAQEVLRCAGATRVPVLVVLPPVSTFDPHGSEVYTAELEGLRQRLGPSGIEVLDLTATFRAAQAGKGEALERRGGGVAVVDQETGKVWLEAPAAERGLPEAVYQLFEREPDVREALMFDDGHPDAEGFVVFARAVADRLPAAAASGAAP